MAAHDRDLLKTPHFCLALQGRSMDAPRELRRSPPRPDPPASAESPAPGPLRPDAPISTGRARRPVPPHQPSASIFPACLPPQHSSQANNLFHRPFAGGLLRETLNKVDNAREKRSNPNTVHFTSTMAAVKSIRMMGCDARGRSG